MTTATDTGGDVLIIGPSWVGDMVMSQPLIQVLRQAAPDSRIDVLAPAWSEPLLERMPGVRGGVAMPLGHGDVGLCARRRLGHSLRPANYQQAIVLPNSLKSALVPFFAGIPRRTGWVGEMRYGLLNDIRKLDKQALPLMVERFVALGVDRNAPLPDPLPRPQLHCDPAAAQQLCEQRDLSAGFVALCPGAEFGPAKRWPEQHYAAVADAVICRGLKVALFGSAKDREVGEAIIRNLSSNASAVVNLCGETALGEAVDLLSAAQAVVSNDSGLMHIAAALQRPLVVVYGSTSPGFTPPMADRVAIEQLDLPCSPCFQRECPLGHLQCLKELSPDRVIASLNALLETG